MYLNEHVKIMKYNIYYHTKMSGNNIIGLDEDKMKRVVDAYKKGKEKFSISGQQYSFSGLKSLQIFTHENGIDPALFEKKVIASGKASSNLIGHYLSPEILETVGKNITDELIGDLEFGEYSTEQDSKTNHSFFINPNRIIELREIDNDNFDLEKLIKFCIELNDNFQRENYYSVAMLGRSILNHIPPIFGFKRFTEVASNYGGKSFKGNMNHLQNSMKNIADNYLHETIRRKENLPNSTQVNFSQDLDVLLGEIIRKLNE
jgi:hypothetical protein